MAALQSDEDVGLAQAPLQSDADVGLQSDADVGIVEKSWWERGQVKPTALTMDPSVRTGPYVEHVLKAFGHGFAEGFGPERLGVSPETEKTLQGWGIFRSGEGDRFNPIKAMNEVLTHAIIATPELALRFGGGLLRAGQAAAVEAGLPRDIAALPEAFFGMPHPLGIPKTMPEIAALEASSGERFWYQGVAGKNIDNPRQSEYWTTDIEKARDYAPGGIVRAVRESDIPPDVLERLQTSGTATRLRGSGEPYEVVPLKIAGEFPANETVIDLHQARDLGIIGPERPSINEGAPKDAAAMAAEQKKPETLKSEPLDSWQQRFEHFVTKLDTADDVKQLIRDAARENNDFLPARQGDIPLQHVEAVAQAAGVEPGEINARGLGRTLRNDAEVRVAMQTMLQLTDNVKAAARDVKADGSPESLIKLQEAIMRRDLAVEQVVGLRAEWGRTGNVIQEFMRDVKDQDALNTFLKDKGRTPSDLHEIARAIDQLDRTGAAKVLSDARNQPGPIYWTWVNGLISGLLTHTKYVAANAFYTGIERGVTTPIAAMIGKAKEVLGAEAERVYFGEAAASAYGMIAATFPALWATAKSIKAGVRMPLESEVALRAAAIARGDKVPATLERSVNPLTGMSRPIPGIWGRIIGAPGDAAMGIHTFFKIIGERAGLEEEAYHAAAKEGLSPASAEFWTRRAEIAANPTETMRANAVEGAYKGTFMAELGTHGKKWQLATKSIPGLKWLFPFSHIPVNLMKATYEHTPMALFDKTMREDILGNNGGVAQDKAIARMVVGSAIMGYFVNSAMNGRATGDYPRDPKERDVWKLEGKQPNSILIGDHWVSFNRFGPVGNLANMGANIAYVIPHLTSGDDEAMTKATWHAANAAARLVVDEVGMLSLAMMFEAIHDEKKGTAYVASQASSLIPFSSFLSQTASGGLPGVGGGDPHMREAKTFIDGIKYRIPFARETLLPKRDWSGQPVDNPQYGNILRQRQVNTNPVDLEMARLGLHPAPPQDRIGGVKLPPAMYDRYQTVAGAFTRTVLENMVAQPGWSDLPAFVREDIFRKTIAATRQGAAATMQARYPQIIEQGVQNRLDHINGVKPTKLKEAAE